MYSVTDSSRGEYLGVYGAFGLCQIIFTVLASFSLATGGIFASRQIHKRLLTNILRLPMSFFDTTPSGQILNRFSKDINTVDETVPRSIRTFIFTCFTVLSTIIVISYATPLFMIVILPLTILYVLIQVRRRVFYICNTLLCNVLGIAILCGHFTSVKATRVCKPVTNFCSFPRNTSRSVCTLCVEFVICSLKA